MNKGDLIVVHMRSGMLVLGKQGDIDDKFTVVDSPRVVQGRQKGPTVEMAILELIGKPTSITLQWPDIFMLYPMADGSLIADYIKSTTGLTLASVTGEFKQ